ncbi:MAG TPA: carboxymuconolactone decarboxylase family protein [Solirubrobacterales bacterium]|nr:carboxymuconolactone decarboxylase family protein [Solirubrobacterales bacterium]
MARIDSPENPSPLTRLAWSMARRQMDGTLGEPIRLMAHSPLLMHGYGGFEMAFQRAKRAPKRLLLLAELKASALCGCEWCMDYGSWLAHHEAGITDEQLRELPRFRESDAFNEDEKLVLEYAEGISRTPVEVPDELFERLRQRFDEAEIVELTWAAAIENMRARFNWALGIESQGYSEGAVCIRPETVPSEATVKAP